MSTRNKTTKATCPCGEGLAGHFGPCATTNAAPAQTAEERQAAALAYLRARLAEDRAAALATIHEAATNVTGRGDDASMTVHAVERLQDAIDAAGRLAVIESIERAGATSLEAILEEIKTQLLRMPTNPFRSSRGTSNLLEIAKGEALRDLHGTVRSLMHR